MCSPHMKTWKTYIPPDEWLSIKVHVIKWDKEISAYVWQFSTAIIKYMFEVSLHRYGCFFVTNLIKISGLNLVITGQKAHHCATCLKNYSETTDAHAVCILELRQ